MMGPIVPLQGAPVGGFPGVMPQMIAGPMVRPPMAQNRMPPSQEAVQAAPDYKKIAEDLRKNQKDFQGKSTDEQKNMLGNIMYSRVRSMQKDENLIPKITGMLIDTEVLEFDEILEIIENDQALRERIDEAIEVINENHEAKDEK